MHRRRIIDAVMLGLFLTLVVVWSSAEFGAGSRAASLCADAYASVQDAIAAADDGDTVRVPTGSYTENIVLTKTITLQGGWDAGCVTHISSDPASTVIDGAAAGSVISITQSAPTLEGLTITGGRAQYGAGVFVKDGKATISNTVVSGNVVSTTSSQDTKGAGVYVENSTARLVNAAVVMNVAEAYPGISLGAGLFIDWHSKATFVATRVLSNTGPALATLRGGGLCIEEPASVDFIGPDNLIASNTAYAGGGIYTWGGAIIQGGRVISNSADYGGGIHVVQGDGGRIANMIVAGNSASYQASGISVSRARTEFANNTIVGNVGYAGTGIGVSNQDYAPVTFTNNIVVGHEFGIVSTDETISPTLITNNVWDNGVNYQGVVAGASDIHVDPLFIDAAGGDYHLTVTSPMIDAGTTLSWLAEDVDGDVRPDFCLFDIGADEVVTGQSCRYVYLPLVVR